MLIVTMHSSAPLSLAIVEPAGADPILTTRAAADMLGVAVSTAQLWIESGALQAWKTPGGHRRIKLSAVTRLIAQRGVPALSASSAATTPTAVAPLVLSDEYLPLANAPYRLPADEAARLRALAASALVDTPNELVFDRLTWLASQITDTPIALIGLLTATRLWFKSQLGLDRPEIARDAAFCNHAILQDTPLLVEDATLDPRFRDNPLVTGAPHLRFYAGVALRDADGHCLGALCVLDHEPRRLRARELRALCELAAIASEELGRRR